MATPATAGSTCKGWFVPSERRPLKARACRIGSTFHGSCPSLCLVSGGKSGKHLEAAPPPGTGERDLLSTAQEVLTTAEERQSEVYRSPAVAATAGCFVLPSAKRSFCAASLN